ncbi:MAG: NAD(+) synthase [Trueperaceae bacterium]
MPRQVLDVHPRLRIEPESLTTRLVTFLHDVVSLRYGYGKVILGLSGGADSAVVAYLAARAFGSENVIALRLPYRDLGIRPLEHAELVIDALGLPSETIDIAGIVDAYAEGQPGMDWHRRGNVQARARMIVLFDKMVEFRALPIGTGNRSEILFGYFTQHGDDAPQVNPIGDLYKSQVWQLAAYLAVPQEIIDKDPSAGLEPGQTDEGDFGLPYMTVDLVLSHLEGGFGDSEIRELGVSQEAIDEVRQRVLSTHRKRVPTLVPQVQPATADPTLFLSSLGERK